MNRFELFEFSVFFHPLPFGKGKEGKGLSDRQALSLSLSQREKEICGLLSK